MWSITDLKARARLVLSRTYWKSVLFCFLVIAILSAVSGVVSMIISFGTSMFGAVMIAMGSIMTGSSDASAAGVVLVLLVYLLIIVSSLVFMVAFSTFVSMPALTGQNRFFMRAREGKEAYNDGFFVFNGRYFHVVKTLFFQMLFTTLWSFLFIIPGIVKMYEYSMIPYILAENPTLDRQRVFAISRAMTEGEKWKIFLFQLSFIGWSLLSIITCGLGIFFLNPYIQAGMAELYAAMRDKALYIGAATQEELPGFLN